MAFALAILTFPTSLPGVCRAAGDGPTIVPRDALVLETAGRRGRTLVRRDEVMARIVDGSWTAPREGDEITLPDGQVRRWERAEADANGSFRHAALQGGYADVTVSSDDDRIVLLRASGHDAVTINGVPRTGDPYGHGYTRLPVRLKKGANDLLFAVGRGGLNVTLVPPRAEVQIETADSTLPDLIVGQEVGTWGAVVVVNATETTLEGARLEAALADGSKVATPVPPILPLATRKASFRLEGPGPAVAGEREVALRLLRGADGASTDEAKIRLRVLAPEATHKRTFLSEIDGSVQYFAVVPAKGAAGAGGERPGLILSLHGASVEGLGQAQCYGPKPWAHVVAPTNRRPYGFDWEEWGRLDALEVLELARTQLATDPRRTFLTGHSMGGHGTWNLGVTYPDRFAAIAPSAGWVSMMSYAGATAAEKPSPMDDLLLRARSASDTLALAPNAATEGVYVLHGDADDNVPVSEARTMRNVLAGFHPDFAYYERPGAGHWWGNACVDWPPLVEFLERHTLPRLEDVRKVDFVTASPGVSARCHWIEIGAQLQAMKPSEVHLTLDRDKGRFAGTTRNVARLALDLGAMPAGKEVAAELDGGASIKLGASAPGRRAWLVRRDGAWATIDAPAATLKGPHRSGPFKEAFRNRMLFVYGTRGTPEENAWALAKARLDAEVFWYRGNGSVDVISDAAFDPRADRDRNVILFGNAETNAAWDALLRDGPVRVGRGAVRVGGRELKGDNLACLFLRPRPGSDRACVGVVSGTGLVGMRMTDRLPYFISGVGYPDLLVLGAEAHRKGNDGIRGAGYFGQDWGVDSGEFAWAE